MAQQTAVEWLMSEMLKPDMYKIWPTLLERAKAMEKEQRVTDYNAGYNDAQCNHINDAENYASEQEYINS